MAPNVAQAEGFRMSDELPEDAATPGECADLAPSLLIDPHVQEALELLLSLVEDSESGIVRTGQLARGGEHLPQDRLESELRHERAADVEEALQLRLVEAV
jgi:hypothetical protein